MMTSSFRPLAAACILALLAPAPVLPAAPTPSDTPLVAPSDPLDATDASLLRPFVGQDVTVKGTVTGSGAGKSGKVAYLNFAGAHKGVALVFFLKPGTTGKAGTEDDLKPFVGKTITVFGKLEDYKGDLQIKVESLDDLKAAP